MNDFPFEIEKDVHYMVTVFVSAANARKDQKTATLVVFSQTVHFPQQRTYKLQSFINRLLKRDFVSCVQNLVCQQNKIKTRRQVIMFQNPIRWHSRSLSRIILVCAKLAQLVRSLNVNQKVPSSIPGMVEGWILGDLLLPHHLWTGTLSRWSTCSLSTFYRETCRRCGLSPPLHTPVISVSYSRS